MNMRSVLVRFLAAMVCLLGVRHDASAARPPSWSNIDALEKDGKLNEAAAGVSARLKAAKVSKDANEWTLALVRSTKLKLALHGYEDAVRFLRAEPRPAQQRAALVLSLYEAKALTTYADAYAHELRTREPRDGERATLDFGLWTYEQVRAEAETILLKVWEKREQLGQASIDTVSEYVEPATPLKDVRGTTRDVLAYALAGLFADASGWTPSQSRSVSTLSVDALLAGPKTPALTSATSHPLEKAAAVLADHEAWHRMGGRAESAIEARLEWTRLLSQALPAEASRTRVERDLQKRLVGWNGKAGASRARALHAELIEGAGDLARALTEATNCASRGGEATGLAACRALAARLQAPDFQMVTTAVDGAGRRSVMLEHKNLPKVFLRAYPIDLPARIASAESYALLPQGEALEKLLASEKPAAAWTVELPATPDLRTHRTYSTPPTVPEGAYLLVASASPEFRREGNRRLASLWLRSALVLSSRALTPLETELAVVDGNSGQPVPEVSVEVLGFDRSGRLKKVAGAKTGKDGLARVSLGKNVQANVLLATKGKDLACELQGVSRMYEAGSRKDLASLLYTDRSVYRPGQTVQWKAVVFERSQEGRLLTAKERHDVTVRLQDANGEVVETMKAKTNGFGSASGSFRLPESGRLLGEWSLTSEPAGRVGLRVEAYKRPTFEVELSSPVSAPRLNAPVKMTGRAQYLFGQPLTGAPVRWYVVRRPLWPTPWRTMTGRGFFPPQADETVASGVSRLGADGRFDFTFTPAADAGDARDGKRHGGYRYDVHADVTDDGGETRTGTKSLRLGFTAIAPRITAANGFELAGSVAEVELFREDLEGQPRKGSGTWRLVELELPSAPRLPSEEPVAPSEDAAPSKSTFRTPGDALRPRHETDYRVDAVLASWKSGREVARGTVQHGDDGRALWKSPALKAGVYRLLYETRDDHGQQAEAAKEILVAGEGARLPLPALLRVQRTSVAAGETARVWVHSAFEGQSLVLELFRGGRRQWRRVLLGSARSNVIDVPVGKEHRSGLTFSLHTVRDYQLVSESQEVAVPFEDLELDVSFETFRDRLQPGAKERFTVLVKSKGKPVSAGSAELLAYMYDRALDAMAPHEPVSPSVFRYAAPPVPPLQTQLGAAQTMWLPSNGFGEVASPPEIQPERLKLLDGASFGGPGGRGGPMVMMEMASSPKVMRGKAMEQSARSQPSSAPPPNANAADAMASAPAPAPVRENFAETAFFLPHLTVDAKGTAAWSFEVPDSLTEWSVRAHAFTRALAYGQTERRAKSAKALMVRPYLPRFLRAGDAAELRVMVQNTDARAHTGTLTLDLRDAGTNAELAAVFGWKDAASARKTFTLAAGASQVFTFPLRAPKGLQATVLTARAEADGVSDGERRALPVLPSRLHLSQSQSVALKAGKGSSRSLSFADAAKTDASRTSEQLVVTVDEQLLDSVIAAVPSLLDIPHPSSDAWGNRLFALTLLEQVYARHPHVAARAKALSKARKTPLQPWESGVDDPNRKLLLDESPWKRVSQGGEAKETDAGLLDPSRIASLRADALRELNQIQLPNGGFPWFQGGAATRETTLQVLHTLARLKEFDAEPPKELAARAWAFLAKEQEQEASPASTVWMLFVASSFPSDVVDPAWPADARKNALDVSAREWRKEAPYLKGLLALTLERAGRKDEARAIWSSVMDAAKTTENEGTFWAPESKSWLWYNDTLESHAFALRVTQTLTPKDERRHGLVQWLFLNKKLNQWKSSRATAEVLASLMGYLEAEGRAKPEAASVSVAFGERTERFDFGTSVASKATADGHRQWVVTDPPNASLAAMSASKTGPGIAFVTASWHFATDTLPTEPKGNLLSVEKTLLRRQRIGTLVKLVPVAANSEVHVGDELEIQLLVRVRHEAEYVHLVDPRAAGLEPALATSGHRYRAGMGWYEEVRDSGTNFFFDRLPVGEYRLGYRLRASVGGTFRVGPAQVQSFYAPEHVAYSEGTVLRIASSEGK